MSRIMIVCNKLHSRPYHLIPTQVKLQVVEWCGWECEVKTLFVEDLDSRCAARGISTADIWPTPTQIEITHRHLPFTGRQSGLSL